MLFVCSPVVLVVVVVVAHSFEFTVDEAEHGHRTQQCQRGLSHGKVHGLVEPHTKVQSAKFRRRARVLEVRNFVHFFA